MRIKKPEVSKEAKSNLVKLMRLYDTESLMEASKYSETVIDHILVNKYRVTQQVEKTLLDAISSIEKKEKEKSFIHPSENSEEDFIRRMRIIYQDLPPKLRPKMFYFMAAVVPFLKE